MKRIIFALVTVLAFASAANAVITNMEGLNLTAVLNIANGGSGGPVVGGNIVQGLQSQNAFDGWNVGSQGEAAIVQNTAQIMGPGAVLLVANIDESQGQVAVGGLKAQGQEADLTLATMVIKAPGMGGITAVNAGITSQNQILASPNSTTANTESVAASTFAGVGPCSEALVVSCVEVSASQCTTVVAPICPIKPPCQPCPPPCDP